MSKKTKLILFATTLGLLIIALIIPHTREWLIEALELLGSGNVEAVQKYILSYGPLAVLISFLMMILQSIIAPIPAFIITFANAAIFGWFWGAILSWTSAMAGAGLCFAIARIYGRDIVIKFTGNKVLKSIDSFFTKYGTNAILIARFLPFVPFDPISYAAGLTPMKFRKFFIATGIGQLPATLVYSYVGSTITGGTKLFINGLLVLFAVFTLGLILKDKFKKNGIEFKEDSK
ncbi:MAG: TVP38/TMEM64 family protein [Firmicutes bacterium]|nr:TVP38/TMEM64 family protein [Bacillota bacterium]